jgi:Uma2 family endonuclease
MGTPTGETTMGKATLTAPVDRELFSLHPEEQMTERPSHRRQVAALEHAISKARPDLFVAANLGIYWVPGQYEHPWVGPDLLVSHHVPARDDPSVYLTFEDGPVAFVAEVASPSTRSADEKKRDDSYAPELRVPEYLWIDLARHELQLWTLVGIRYEPLPPDEHGRLWSRELELGFAWQADQRLVRVLLADGTVLPTGEEEADQAAAASARAEREAQRAEREAQRAEREAQRAEREARRAEEEAAARAAAEQRAAALAEELERLRRVLDQGSGGPGSD